MPKLTARLIGIIVAGLLVLAIVFGGPAACQKIRSLNAQSKVAGAQTKAGEQSAGDAVNTVTGVGTNQSASEELGRNNEHDIRKAPGADQKVDPGVNTAGRAALCKRKAYQNEPMCKGAKP